MADERLTTMATTAAAADEEVADGERQHLNVAADCVTASDPSSTGVAFVDMPTTVLKISDCDYAVDDDDDDEQGDSLPYPEYVEKAFFYLLQTTRPRNWCLQLITWPYPFCTRCLI